MKLATFNIESYGGDRFDPSGLRPRIDALRPRIEELDADILCLQEVNAQKVKGASQRRFLALDLLLAGTPYETFHRAASERAPGKGPGDKHNLVILSRYPIPAHESLFQLRANAPLWQPSTAEPGYDCPQNVTFERPILRSEINVGGLKPLHLFVVHLRAPIAAMIRGGKTSDRTWKSTSAWAEGYLLSVLKQSAQALELRLAVEALFDRDEKAQIVLAGDFNATGETGTLRLLRADPDDTASPEWAHRRLFQLDASLPLADRQTVLHRGKGQALDHILASGTMTDRVVDVHVFNAGLPDEVFEADDATYAGSYHAAMRAQFDI